MRYLCTEKVFIINRDKNPPNNLIVRNFNFESREVK